MTNHMPHLPIAVIGAGPVGLAAAAHLVKRGMEPLILEAGPEIAMNLRSYRHVRLFSSWRYNLDGAARELLQASGWAEPDLEALPTAGEMIEMYLDPLAKLPQIAKALHLGEPVMRISRAGKDKVQTRGRENAAFLIRTRTARGEKEWRVQAVIDATGTWNQPNPIGASGLPALGEQALAEQISYGMPDVAGRERERYAGKRVLVVGAGHSAAGSLIALVELAEEVPLTEIFWVVRGKNPSRVFGGGSRDGLPARGALGQRLKSLSEQGRLTLLTSFQIRELVASGNGIDVLSEDGRVIQGVDEIIGSTGARPNLEMARELRLELDPMLESCVRLAPLIDPNEHSCGTVRPHGHRELAHPESGYYTVGAKSYGRAPNFLLATGYEQVRSVVAALAGDLAAADDVRLELPETGVCSTDLESAGNSGPKEAACCGPSPAPVPREQACAKKKSSCCG